MLLTMTPAMVAAVQEYNELLLPQEDTSPSTEPSLADPAAGKPISHSQILDIQKKLKSSSKSHTSPHLDDLLRGASIYTPPPKPKIEPVCEMISYAIFMTFYSKPASRHKPTKT